MCVCITLQAKKQTNHRNYFILNSVFNPFLAKHLDFYIHPHINCPVYLFY